MAITNLATLEAAVTDRTARADLSSVIDELVQLCEAEMQRELRVQDMEVLSQAYTISAEYQAFPANYLQLRDLYYVTSCKQPLEYMSFELMTRKHGYGTPCPPRFYCQVGNQFRFAPVPDTSYSGTIVFYSKIPALSAGANWLVAAHPDAYLWGTCKQVAIRDQDQNAAQGYDTLFTTSLDRIKAQSNRSRNSGPVMYSRPG